MERVTMDSGFGYPLDYPVNGDINILFTIKKIKKGENDRYILMEYLPNYPFCKVLQSQIPNLDNHAKSFLLSKLPDIDSGKYDTYNLLAQRLYATERKY
ncbi:hypothetical protein [Halobacillus sp. Marseille-Q1614]|uniref:hypothetical protein n=1 Tax=Halobacillus sp. Marseille-Q1614 TaxID=2709134 RepID=UPI00156F85C8|nr:hypothetical protein [Halobacillus sp. Marseille-Q1614]